MNKIKYKQAVGLRLNGPLVFFLSQGNQQAIRNAINAI